MKKCNVEIERWSIEYCIKMRKFLGLTLADVGRGLGTSRQYTHNMEKCKNNIKKSSVIKYEILYTLYLKEYIRQNNLNIDLEYVKNTKMSIEEF